MVARVQGAVAGAGLAFVLNADLIVAARSTKFVVAYGAIGLTPDCGVSYLLPRAVGAQRALELALTPRVLTADEAQSWGLVTRVSDDDRAAADALELARRLAAESTFALGRTRRLIREAWEVTRVRSAADEVASISHAIGTPFAESKLVRFTPGAGQPPRESARTP